MNTLTKRFIVAIFTAMLGCFVYLYISDRIAGKKNRLSYESMTGGLDIPNDPAFNPYRSCDCMGEGVMHDPDLDPACKYNKG